MQKGRANMNARRAAIARLSRGYRAGDDLLRHPGADSGQMIGRRDG